ncbi:MAG: tetraacyldisaccharide 4'-kinase, partial [Bacteroidetes bacterium HGW-Bacteroidetes-21]
MFSWGILRSTEFRIPVICVGNITVGGTGKTPHVEYVSSLLKDNYRLAVVSRGYKRKTKGYYEVSGISSAWQAGDEPLQIKRKFPMVRVITDGNRCRAINKLLKQDSPPEVVILDDAFQHRYVKPGLSILLTDYNRLLTRDYIMPYGYLRESSSMKRQAGIIIVTKTPENIPPINRRLVEKEIAPLPYQYLFFTTIKYNNPVALEENAEIKFKVSFESKKYDILLISGIANPETLLTHVRKYARILKHMPFPDHHNFSEKDINGIVDQFNSFSLSPEKIIVTTEKDAIRISSCFKKEIIS